MWVCVKWLSLLHFSYAMMKNADFLNLPVPQLTRHGSLVVVWVTNKQKDHNFVRKELFPAWNVQYITQWFWLKASTPGFKLYTIYLYMYIP